MAVDSEFIDPGEQIVAVIHKHWVNIFPILFAWGIVGLVILAGFYSIGKYAEVISKVGPVYFVVLALGAMAALWVLLIYLSFYIYRQNRLILTNKNFIHIERAGLLRATVTQFALNKVQDVSVQQHGLSSHLLKYGNIIIETAGEVPNLTFRQVGQPHTVADQIMDLHEQAVSNIPAPQI